jgi:hypothetical protein
MRLAQASIVDKVWDTLIISKVRDTLIMRLAKASIVDNVRDTLIISKVRDKLII